MIGTMSAARSITATALAFTALATVAGTLQVTITGADGKPAADTVVLVQPSAPSPVQPPAEPVVIGQKDIRFQPYVSVVQVGGTVRFVNRDTFDHHVRSQAGGPLGSVPPAKEFEFRLARARGGVETSADLKLDVPGTVLLGCHLHNSMRGHLYVSSSPWYAVTDDKGRAKIDGVPDGAAEVRLWHPDQLVDQPLLKVQVAGTASADSRLNFTPRKRPPPVRKGEYDF